MQYEQNAYRPTGGKNGDAYKKNVVTPTIALMYKPEINTTLYGSYVKSMEQVRPSARNSKMWTTR